MRKWVRVTPLLLTGLLDCGSPRNRDAAASSGFVADAGPTAAAPDPGGAGNLACLASSFLSDIGSTNKLLVGADMTESVAEMAPFDIRYLYLAGGLPDGTGPCSSCASGCTAAGVACANSGPGCEWWGCWQDDRLPPGQYVRDLISRTQSRGQLPLISYYELLQTSGVAEGSPEVAALTDATLMTRYFNDWRFVLQQIGTARALLHIEPDLWGYAEQLDSDPHGLAAAVTGANATDCAAQENSLAGFARCLVAMVRKYAPNARVGLHASSWGTGIDVHENTDPAFDLAGEARRAGDFLLACGAGGSDFVVVEASDRDAGYYKSIGKNTFWDATNATLPDFQQAFDWTRFLTARIGRPALWWQLPLGNMSLPNIVQKWQDNRVDYFFTHAADVARTNAFGMVFGAGNSLQTNPSTDGGNFVTRVQQLAAQGGQPVCQ